VAWAYLGAVVFSAAVVIGVSAFAEHPRRWPLFVVLLAAAAVAQLFIVVKPGHQSYRTAIVFFLAAALLLSPLQAVLIAVLHYVPDWVRRRKSWHVRLFNAGGTVLSVIAAWGAFHLLRDQGDLRYALAGLAACVAFFLTNHFRLAFMLRLANGTSLRETKLFTFESVATDLALAGLGIGVATAWSANPWTLLFVVAPLVLVHRALHVPQLEVEARVDAKTGLLNAREFETSLADELARAERTAMPLALVMIDLDLLRDINNVHGHLAGDAVLRGVAGAVREDLRRGDLAARFGGEEFAVLLPATDHEQAKLIAERIRAAVEERTYEDATVAEPMRATISVGVATYPWHGRDAKQLVSEADKALYLAKDGGRNRVIGCGSPVPVAVSA
jgi:diguanylate cyclase (GGDEF)-like protein